ncbi:related to 3-oxoacyl-[acyl-carrier-protein] reductase [Zygosaccharomyces bailii]|nr:related to 3-oxoacyl-[acyl-carrier-protein] reductase [Zygosaccharomyces bailii]
MTHIEPVALITGASRGIGKAIVQKLSRQGLSCICVASSKESISHICLGDHLSVTRKHQRHRSLAVDLARWPQWLSQKSYPGIDYLPLIQEGFFPLLDTRSWAVEQADVQYRLSLLVNCAGTTQSSISLRTDPLEAQRIMNINFMSSISMCNSTIRSMIRSRTDSSFPLQIINVSSVLGASDLVIPGTSVYTASKAALSHYTKVLAQEILPLGIRVASISPGLVSKTDMIKGLDQSAQTKLKEIMKSKVSTPEEIASQVWAIYSGH